VKIKLHFLLSLVRVRVVSKYERIEGAKEV